MNLPQLWFLTGCTAVGKTDLSLKLAQFLDAEVLSCDSIQVYRGADIGSAKINLEMRQGIPHHGIDLCDAHETFDVGQYTKYAQFIIDQMQKKRKNLLVVGGTGFYLKSFFAPIIDGIRVPEEVRKEVQLLYENSGMAALQQQIKRYGPVDLNPSDWNNPLRLISLLGKQRMTGLAQVDLKRNFLQKPCLFDKFSRKVVYLVRNSASLNQRIEHRVEAMFCNGFIEEVRNLGSVCLPLAKAVGYREVRTYLDYKETKEALGDISAKTSEKELKASIVAATRQLVKKQKTWFRQQISVHYSINLDEHPFNESFDFIASFCKNSGI
ncbi:MAG: tRNA (adenosine(37)-N6)-dimethylallyltransferase MiaA [Puniceicoccales bacterium]|nr:tRNA (adenosine(37)-N6)-dimethylallyltransferase MiaA [Puniceicoccales bacterium]